MKGRQDGEFKKKVKKHSQKKLFIHQVTCFCHMNAYGMLPVVIIKSKNRKSLALEKFDMSEQEYKNNRYGYRKME